MEVLRLNIQSEDVGRESGQGSRDLVGFVLVEVGRRCQFSRGGELFGQCRHTPILNDGLLVGDEPNAVVARIHEQPPRRQEPAEALHRRRREADELHDGADLGREERSALQQGDYRPGVGMPDSDPNGLLRLLGSAGEDGGKDEQQDENALHTA